MPRSSSPDPIVGASTPILLGYAALTDKQAVQLVGRRVQIDGSFYLSKYWGQWGTITGLCGSRGPGRRSFVVRFDDLVSSSDCGEVPMEQHYLRVLPREIGGLFVEVSE